MSFSRNNFSQLFTAFFLLLTCCFCSSLAYPTQNPNINLKSVDGSNLNPFQHPQGTKAVVFFFVSHDCPISNQYAAEFNRLYREYAPKLIDFYLVYVDAELTSATARKHYASYKYLMPALLEVQHRLVGYAGATVTPEVAVFDSNQTRIYLGRIDERFPRLSMRRQQATSFDLREAIDAVLTGRPVAVLVTKAIGCYIASNE